MNLNQVLELITTYQKQGFEDLQSVVGLVKQAVIKGTLPSLDVMTSSMVCTCVVTACIGEQ